MPDLLAATPARRPELLLKPLDDSGRCVVKNLRTGAYFQLGAEESFLLSQLDGTRTPEALCAAFEEQFGQELSHEDFDDFLELAREQGFLQPDEAEADPTTRAEAERAADEVLWALRHWPVPGAEPETLGLPGPPSQAPAKSAQSLFFWRFSLFDPDRLFNALEPRLQFLWTRSFLNVSAALILAAFVLVGIERQQLVSQLPKSVHWQTLVLTALVMLTVTLFHEFAHGLTCKHYGGEVHEVGVLVMYFMPCFYCNVSDSYLLGDRAKRLWVTLAGGYCDLVLWALGVFVWRVTRPDSLINYLAWLVLSVCGVRMIFNFNPLIKLDGYYLASDLLGIHNMHPRGRAAVMSHLRWLLWGAPRPASEPRGGFLVGYGLVSWLLSMLLVGLFLLKMGGFLGAQAGVLGLGWTAFLGVMSVRGLFRGIAAGEVRKMIELRRKRSATWALGLAAVSFVLAVVPIDDRAGGEFNFRPAKRFELRAPIAGFLREVYSDVGASVSPGAPIARLDVPDLDSRLAQKHAEVRESEAKLRMLKVGPRPEELAEERLRVKRTKAWSDLARRDLDRTCQSFREEVAEIEQQIRQYQAESEKAAKVYSTDKALWARHIVQPEQLRETEKLWRVAEAQMRQAEARRGARQAEGTLIAEAELARRETEMAEAEAKLRLLEAGTRPEEIDVETARLARLEEEVRYLEAQTKRLPLFSPFLGVIVTPRFKEKIGQFFQEGELICEVESMVNLEAEITVSEQDALRIRPGQPIQLKIRSLPYHSILTNVERVAPSMVRPAAPGAAPASPAAAASTPGTIVIYCQVPGSTFDLRSGMTGYARINYGRRPIGAILADRVLRVLRTEFWW